jgi:hypothetical protein
MTAGLTMHGLDGAHPKPKKRGSGDVSVSSLVHLGSADEILTSDLEQRPRVPIRISPGCPVRHR